MATAGKCCAVLSEGRFLLRLLTQWMGSIEQSTRSAPYQLMGPQQGLSALGTVTQIPDKKMFKRCHLERHEVHYKCLGAVISQYCYTFQHTS